VLWDCFADSTRHLGGAPLNFAAHVAKLGHPAALLTGVGGDTLGDEARDLIAGFDVDTRFLQVRPDLPTGVARVQLNAAGVPAFDIPRPAAFDGLRADTAAIAEWAPRWLYYGSLYASRPENNETLRAVLAAVPDASRICDVNLRPGSIVDTALLREADVLKLSEDELPALSEALGLPKLARDFCIAGAERFGWGTVAITLGPQGCALYHAAEYVQSPGIPVTVADTVGAGDAFTAALLHGVDLGWPPHEIAAFANKVGSIVAGRHGAIPHWSPDEASTHAPA
jgi:fructokinase